MATVTKDSLKPGRVHLKDGRVFDFKPENVRYFLERQQEMLKDGLHIPVTWEHQDDAKPLTKTAWQRRNADLAKATIGHVGGVALGQGGTLNPSFDAQDDDIALMKKVKFISPHIEWDHKDPETGKVYPGPSILHYAVTNRPVQGSQKPFALSQADLPTAPMDIFASDYQEPVSMSENNSPAHEASKRAMSASGHAAIGGLKSQHHEATKAAHKATAGASTPESHDAAAKAHLAARDAHAGQIKRWKSSDADSAAERVKHHQAAHDAHSEAAQHHAKAGTGPIKKSAEFEKERSRREEVGRMEAAAAEHPRKPLRMSQADDDPVSMSHDPHGEAYMQHESHKDAVSKAHAKLVAGGKHEGGWVSHKDLHEAANDHLKNHGRAEMSKEHFHKAIASHVESGHMAETRNATKPAVIGGHHLDKEIEAHHHGTPSFISRATNPKTQGISAAAKARKPATGIVGKLKNAIGLSQADDGKKKKPMPPKRGIVPDETDADLDGDGDSDSLDDLLAEPISPEALPAAPPAPIDETKPTDGAAAMMHPKMQELLQLLSVNGNPLPEDTTVENIVDRLITSLMAKQAAEGTGGQQLEQDQPQPAPVISMSQADAHSASEAAHHASGLAYEATLHSMGPGEHHEHGPNGGSHDRAAEKHAKAQKAHEDAAAEHEDGPIKEHHIKQAKNHGDLAKRHNGLHQQGAKISMSQNNLLESLKKDKLDSTRKDLERRLDDILRTREGVTAHVVGKIKSKLTAVSLSMNDTGEVGSGDVLAQIEALEMLPVKKNATTESPTPVDMSLAPLADPKDAHKARIAPLTQEMTLMAGGNLPAK